MDIVDEMEEEAAEAETVLWGNRIKPDIMVGRLVRPFVRLAVRRDRGGRNMMLLMWQCYTRHK